MKRRVRDDDNRSDELLAAVRRRAYELELAIGWTSGLRAGKANAASDSGAHAWKRAARLSEAASAVDDFVRQCRTRNPLVAAFASWLVLIEVDGGRELLERFGITLPVTVEVASKRGAHYYLRPPHGRSPLKVQVSAEGVITSSDGYVIAAGALHESGWVYSYATAADVGIAEISVETYDRLLELGAEIRENVRRSLEGGGMLVEGLRRDTLFSIGLELAHRGLDEDLVGDLLLEINRRRCSPPLRAAEVKAQAHGALVRVRQRPSAAHELQQRALEVLSTIEEAPRAEPASRIGRPSRKYPEAVELVRQMLADGPRLASEIKEEGRRHGVSERTVERVAKELGVLSESTGDRSGKGGRVAYWHPSAFCRDLDFSRAKSVPTEIGSDKLKPLTSVGSSGGLVTPVTVAPPLLSRPTSETFVATDPKDRKRPPRRQP